MSIQERRYDIIEKVMQLDEQSLELLEMSIRNLDAPFERVSINQYNRELEEANARVEAGDYITQEDLENEAKKW